MSEEQLRKFQKLAQPLMDYLAASGNPYVTVIITPEQAMYMIGQMGVPRVPAEEVRKDVN